MKFRFLVIYLLLSGSLFSHAPPPGAGEQSGPVVLSDAAVHNLGITTAKAETKILQPTLDLLGRVQLMPSRQARIGARFEGVVTRVLVNQGERVLEGQDLLEIQPHVVGGRAVNLKSPLNGYVYSHAVILGQTFDTNTVLMEIADDSEVYVQASTFDVSVLDQLTVGNQGVITLDGYPNERFQGEIVRIEPYLHHDSQTFNIFVRVKNEDRKLKPNLKANLSVAFGEGIEGVIVPKSAVVGNEGNLFVFIQDDKNTYERRVVKLGIEGGDNVEIISGILSGEEVVLQGNYQLQFAKSSPGMGTAGADPHDHGGHGHGDHDHGDHDHEDHGDHHHAESTSANMEALDFIKGLWIGLSIGVGVCVVVSVLFHIIGKLRGKTSVSNV